MNKRLLSITDENSISITAEFLCSGYVLKNGEQHDQYYELDLIVRNDITCNQLLGAISAALQQQLREKYGLDPAQINGKTVYEDLRYPSGVASRKNGQLFSQENRRGKNRQDLSDLEEYILENREQKKAHVSRAEAEHDTLIACWKVFQECIDAYVQGYPQSERPTLANLADGSYGRHPVIARGSINLRELPDGELLSVAHNSQIWLRVKEDGNRTLRELGFVRSSRLIFDPVMWHHSGALFDPRFIRRDAWERLPVHAITGRSNLTLSVQDVRICAPDPMPECNRVSIAGSFFFPLIASGSIVGVWASAGLAMPVDMGILASAMVLSGLAVGLTSRFIHKSTFNRDVRQWCGRYQRYINGLLEQISQKQQQDAALLNRQYPPAFDPDGSSDLVHLALRASGSIFSRRRDYADFLAVRVGHALPGSRLVASNLQLQTDIIPTTFSPIQYQNIRNKPNYPFKLVLPHQSAPAPVNTDGTYGFLNELPAAIQDEYSYLTDVPVLLRLHEISSLGILFQDSKQDFMPYLTNLVLDLCFHHTPDDIQFVLLCEQTDDHSRQQEIIRRFKHLPHFGKLLGDHSAFAFNRTDACNVLNRLHKLLLQRGSESKASMPYIVVIAMQDYGLRDHPIADWMSFGNGVADGQSRGISFLLCTHFESDIPAACSLVIKVTPDNHWYLLPNDSRVHTDIENDSAALSRYAFAPDPVVTHGSSIAARQKRDMYLRAFKILSALYHDSSAQSAVPIQTDLFELLEKSVSADGPVVNLTHLTGNPDVAWLWKLRSELTSYVLGQSLRDPAVPHYRNPSVSLSVPFGIGESGIVQLDLHRCADGPHLLIASDPGMGKTQSIQHYLTSLCAHYNAQEVNLILVDPNRAGLNNRLRHLPHIVGSVPLPEDAGAQMGIALQLRRMLNAIDLEMNRRRQLLNQMGVKNIDEYYCARKDIPGHVRKTLQRNPAKIEDTIRAMQQLPPIAHLFLVLDHYQDLVKLTEEPGSFIDLNASILRLAESCTDLGLHLILATNDADVYIPQSLRDVFRSALCLKTADPNISRLLIGSALAAGRQMPGDGRGYLLKSGSSETVYLQIGYADADIRHSLVNPFRITRMKTGGEYEMFFDTDSFLDSDLGAFLYTNEETDDDGIDRVNTDGDGADADCDTVQEPKNDSGTVKEPSDDASVVYEPRKEPKKRHAAGSRGYNIPGINRKLTQLEITTLVIMDYHKNCKIPFPKWIFPERYDIADRFAN